MICFYGEFDPFTGSIPPHMQHLPSVCRRLKLLVAACDRVIIAPGSMLEHPLVLPTFEALAPLFRAGRLTTSVHVEAPDPIPWLDARIARQLDHIPPKGRVAGASRGHFRRHELAELRGRWQAIMPSAWAVVRDIPRIVGTYVDDVRTRLSHLAEAPHGAPVQRLVALIDDRRDAGELQTDRNRLLAAMINLRHNLMPVALQQAVAMVQGVYFKQGTSAASKWVRGPAGRQRARFVLYPGFFARLFRRIGGRFAGDLPIEMGLTPWRLWSRMKRLGLSPRTIAAMPAEKLLDLVEHPGWSVTRQALHDDAAPRTWRDAIRGELSRSTDPSHVMHRVESLVPTPTTLTDDWTLAITGDLGSMASTLAQGQALFEPRTGEIRSPDGAARLGPEASRVFMGIVSAGGVGLAHDQVVRLLREIDRAEQDAVVDPPAPRPSDRLLEAARLRVDVAMHRLRLALSPVGVEVVADGGRYRLAGWPVKSTDPRWRASTHAARPPHTMPLPPQLLAVWRLLAAYHPAGLRAPDLGRTMGGLSGPRAAQIVSRLTQRLARIGSDWRVSGGRGRPYRLEPRAERGPGEVA